MKKAIQLFALLFLVSLISKQTICAAREWAITAAAFGLAIPVAIIANKKLDWTASDALEYHIAPAANGSGYHGSRQVDPLNRLQTLAGIVSAVTYGIDWAFGGALFSKHKKS